MKIKIIKLNNNNFYYNFLGNKHYRTKGRQYTIINNLTKMAKELPSVPSLETVVYMKYYKFNDIKPKELAYRPKKIYEALIWLKKHNHLYKNISLNFPLYWNVQNCNDEDMLFLNNNSFTINEDEQNLLFKNSNSCDIENCDDNSESNSSSDDSDNNYKIDSSYEDEETDSDDNNNSGKRYCNSFSKKNNVFKESNIEENDEIEINNYDKIDSNKVLEDYEENCEEILLYNDIKTINHLNDLKKQFGLSVNFDSSDNNNYKNEENNNNVNEQNANSEEILKNRNTNKNKNYNLNNNNINKYEFVNIFQNPDYYFEKCFPTLYPYGYGGPSDKRFKITTLTKYFYNVLQRGGGSDGRRFQSNPNFIFVCYNYEMKKRFTNVAFTAEKDSNKFTENIISITSGELNEIIEYLDLDPDEEKELFHNDISEFVFFLVYLAARESRYYVR